MWPGRELRVIKETGYDIFLPHNSAARKAVEVIARRLVEAGLIPWLDTWNLVPGEQRQEAIETTRRLSQEEGLLVGTSSGANVFAALHVDNGRNRIVTVLPDRAERYFSTALL